MSAFKLPRNIIASFIKDPRGVRHYEQMQDIVDASQDTLINADLAPSPETLIEGLSLRLSRLEQAAALAPAAIADVDRDIPPTIGLGEIEARLARLEMTVALLPRSQPMPYAPDGTYASPTSITIASGVITAIS